MSKSSFLIFLCLFSFILSSNKFLSNFKSTLKSLKISDIKNILPSILSFENNSTNSNLIYNQVPIELNSLSKGKCDWIDYSSYDYYLVKQLTRMKNKNASHNFSFIRESDKNSYSVYYNFCDDNNYTCNGNKGQVILQNNNKSDDCRIVAGQYNETEGNAWQTIYDNSNGNNSMGFSITLTEGEKCNETNKYQTIINVYCNKDITSDEGVDGYAMKRVEYDYFGFGKPFENDNCVQVIEVESKYGCQILSLYSIFKLLKENGVILVDLIYILFR